MPPGVGDGPATNPYVPVLLEVSSCHGPLGAMSPAPTTTVVGPDAAAGDAETSPSDHTDQRQGDQNRQSLASST